jgi:hypothetical protein
VHGLNSLNYDYSKLRKEEVIYKGSVCTNTRVLPLHTDSSRASACDHVTWNAGTVTFTLRRKPYINLRLRPRTYDLHTTSTLRNITRILHKNLAISSISANMTLLRWTTTFLLQFHRILLDYFVFSYTSLSGTTTKTHFTPDFTKETPEKSRQFDTSLRARALLLYDLLSSLLIRQNKTHLASNSTPC